MAKVRRVMRKLAPADRSFDEQLWPVILALLVFGGYLIGIVVAVFPVEETFGRAMAALCIFGIVVFIGSCTALLMIFNNRIANRRALLALVLSLIINFVFLSSTTQMYWVRFVETALAPGPESERERKVIPEYHEFQLDPEKHPKQDFQKPVETEEPEPEPEEIEREEEQPEEAKPKPEEVEVPEPEEEVEPNDVERKIVEQSAPRRSEQQAKLSRQTTKFKPQTAPPAATVSVERPAEKPAEVTAKSTEVARQNNQAQSAKRVTEAEPTTTAEAEQVEITRRETTQEQVAQNTTAPTLQRQMDQPKSIPQTTAAAEPVTAPIAQQTSPDQIKPNTTAAQKQETTSTQVADTPTQPTPDTPTKVAQTKPLARQNLADRMPEQAQTARPVPNRRKPTVTLPNTSAVAARPTNTTSRPTPQEAVRPTDSDVARRAAETSTPSRVPQPTDAPQVTRPLEIAQAATERAQSSEVPTANPTATPRQSPSRNPATSTARVPVNAQAVEVAAAQPTETTNSPRPAGVTASKQQTSTPAVAKVTAEPAPQTPTAVTEVAPQAQRRQQLAQQSPTMASTPAPVARRLAPSTSNPSPATVAAAETTPTQSPVKSDSPSPAPSSSTVARQSAQATATSDSPRAMDVPTKSPTTELARAPSTRATSSDVPTIIPTSRPTNSPARSTNTAAIAASPTAKAAPAAAASTRSTSKPSAEPARQALTKAFGGTAGVGRSANMDRNTPAPESMAAAPSGSVRRAQATQQSEKGPQLSPSAPARIARTRAGANAPSATLVAREVETATVAGAEQSTELTASSSAALQSRRSDAVAGNVTAATGEVDVDVGPTKVVSENSTGKASGGGQPSLNFETRSHKLARSEVGGAPEVTLAAAQVAKVAEAPAGDGGGEPDTPEASPEATSVARTEAGGQSPATGGPASMSSDVSAESASAQQVAEAKIGRADTIQATSGKPVAGGGSSSPKRAATGPKLLNNLVAAAAEPIDAANPPQGTADGSPPLPSKTEIARADASGGAPTTGGPAKAEEVGPEEEEEGEASNVQVALAEGSAGRATAIDASAGRPAAGGGTGSPKRQVSTGPAFAMTTKAEQIALAGAPTSGGIPEGSPIEAQGAEVKVAAAGVSGPASSDPVGALDSDEVMDAPNTGAVGAAPGGGKASPASEDGPQVGGLVSRGGPLKRGAQFQPPAGSADQIAMADVGGGGAVDGEPNIETMVSGMDSTGMNRQTAGGMPVEVSAPEGPGGLGEEVALDAGTMTRRAQLESREVHYREARFIRTRTGGPLAINLKADLGTKAFSGRSKFKNPGLEGEGGGRVPPPKTEKSVELGLEFLANHQASDGSWSLSNFGAGRRGYENERTSLHSDTAATGLCLLAFLGAGYHHQDDKYQEVVGAALQYLIKNQKPSGDVYVDQDPKSSRAMWLYSHGICTIALCEAYGMTQDPELREPAQKAIDFIVNSQNEELGGWRYSPNVGSDTSVTGWQMMALQSGKLAALDVPEETLDGVEHWLELAEASESKSHLYVYNPLAPDTPAQRHGREVNPTMTSVGLLMRMYSGWRRDDPEMIQGTRYLMQHLPSNGTRRNVERDTYYWYYATQVMFHMGGKYWETWNERLHPLLVDSQIQTGPMAGSWDPMKPVPDRWAPHAGRIYVTTLNLLSLEVYYRHLPIYEDTAK